MHIDHSKLVELLTEASGMASDKVEEHLATLVSEIQEAISEGDAYEVDGLGVFSGIGNNVVFIPADDLATEINYKYVGMEPIEMESSPANDEENEAEEPQSQEEPDGDLEDDPFAGLLEDDDEEESGSSSFVEDLINEEYEDADSDTSEEDIVTPAGEDAADEPPFELDHEEDEDQDAAEEEKPGPDKWGIDTYKDDSDAGMFSGLLGDKKEEANEQEEAIEGDEDDLNSIFDDSDDDLEAQISKQLSDETDDDPEQDQDIDDIFGSADDDSESEEDFDDPFDSLDDSDDDDEAEDSKPEEEVVPVITNLASESAKKKREEEKQKDSDSTSEDDSDTKTLKPTREANTQPVLLWVVLLIVIFAGGTYALGYFGVVNIPGVTPEQTQIATTQPQQPAPQTQQPAEQEAAQSEQQEQEPETEETTPETQQPAAETQPEEQVVAEELEQPDQTQVSQSNVAVPEDQPMYGLRGVPNSAANDGYTIVVYSLSNEGNARSKLDELNNDGYRALLASIPSQQYGQLWRVSLGQFESLRTAALAAETLRSPFSESYFITKIK
jgi:cell division septation protein DedD